ncbi:MAG: pyridoxal-dependent decarboxylase, partial [Pseudomonadota bacterium]|nr:pyridoxal-dependent decarboxylase [Pseudomonadota bacterium]
MTVGRDIPDEPDLDPADWHAFRAQAHRMLDEIIDYTEGIRAGPVWRPMPAEVRDGFRAPLPREPQGLTAACDEFLGTVLPYTTGNVHPRFMGWVHGGGNPAGIVADMLAAGLNANLGGRDHAPIDVERQVIRWMAECLGLSPTAGGLLVTGTSAANLIAVLIARTQALGTAVRRQGVAGARLVAYTSAAVHGCVPRAIDMAGFGTDALRRVPTDSADRIDVAALADAIGR